MSKLTRRAAFLLTAAALAGCVVIGPTVPVTPGAGRSGLVFDADRRACMAATDQQVQPIADRRSAAVAAGQGPQGVTNADLQRLYNTAYGTCMAARGNAVAAAPTAQRFPSDSLQSTTSLTDPDSVAARRAVQDVVASSQSACPGERIAVTVSEAPIASSAIARLVVLSTPGGGMCFGQPGQNTYLVAKQGPAWSRLLSAEPGSLDILAGQHNGYRDVQLNSLGTCTYRYGWNGTRYAQAGSDQCATAGPPTVASLATAVRSGAPATGTQAVACPATSSGRPRLSMDGGAVFDGDPADLVQLAPGTVLGPNGRFVNTYGLAAGRAYVLVCRYAGAPDIRLPVGPGARVCRQDNSSFECR